MDCREAQFFYRDRQSSSGTSTLEPTRLEPTGVTAFSTRVREITNQLEPLLRDHRGDAVRSAMLAVDGPTWVVFCRPRLAREVVLIVCPRDTEHTTDLRGFLELLSGHLASCLDRQSMHFVSLIDPVSELFNRKFFDSRLSIECSRARERNLDLTCMLLDVRGLDSIVDKKAVEFALYVVAKAVRRRIRASDFVARVGEQRFGFILPETSAQDSLLLAESIRHLIAIDRSFVGIDMNVISLVCGTATYDGRSPDAENFFAIAETALQQAIGDVANGSAKLSKIADKKSA